MKKLLCALLLLVLMLPAALAEGFVFDGAITWDSTPEDVLACLDGGEANQEDMGDYGVLDTINREGGRCLGFDARIDCLFYDGDLFGIYAYFTEEDLNGDIHALEDRLALDYGEPTWSRPGDAALSLDELFSMTTGQGQIRARGWAPDELTEIELWDFSDMPREDDSSYPYCASLSVLRTDIADEFDDAIEGYWDAED